jgi:hypothetical protein
MPSPGAGDSLEISAETQKRRKKLRPSMPESHSPMRREILPPGPLSVRPRAQRRTISRKAETAGSEACDSAAPIEIVCAI